MCPQEAVCQQRQRPRRLQERDCHSGKCSGPFFELKVFLMKIFFQSNLNGHPNLIGYIDSSVSLLADGVHEVLLLMPYHKTTVLQMMNDRLDTGFTEEDILHIFCDICKGVARLHHCQVPPLHCTSAHIYHYCCLLYVDLWTPCNANRTNLRLVHVETATAPITKTNTKLLTCRLPRLI